MALFTRMNRAFVNRDFLLAVVLGALTPLGYAPFVWFPLPILTLAGLFWLARKATPGRAFLLGWGYAFALFLVGVSWVYISISTYGGMPAPIAALATLLFCAFIALMPGLALLLARQISSTLTSTLPASSFGRVALAMPAAWVLLEWTRGWIFTGFPWLALGYSQAPISPLAGYAPLLGVYGVSLLAALSAGALVAIGLAYQAKRSRQAVGIFAVLSLFWLGGFALQQVAWTQPTAAPISVALLQGNIGQEMKFRPEKLQATLTQYARAVLASDARLIVLPETALPVLRSYLPPDYLAMLRDHAKARNGDILLGIPVDDGRDANGAIRYFNSVISVGTSPEGRYSKVHLVPFGEFVPFGFRWLVDMMSIPLGDFSRGQPNQAALAAAGERLAVNICYEDAFGEERIHAAADATLLVNISNDAWFGDSWSAWQHLQMGAMRSLETGRWQLRANNTGITAIVDEKGRVKAQLKAFTVGTLSGYAQGYSGKTPYMRWGNAAALALIFLVLISSLFLRHQHD